MFDDSDDVYIKSPNGIWIKLIDEDVIDPDNDGYWFYVPKRLLVKEDSDNV